MSTFVNNDVSSGAIVYAADHNTQGSLLAAVINGGIDNNNISSSAAIATSKLADDAGISYAKVTTGFVIQSVIVAYSAVATGTTVLPGDDTIPQNTEGIQFMTASITPKSASSKLQIEVVALAANSAANDINIALFRDSTANAVAAQSEYNGASNAQVNLSLFTEESATSTSSTTFNVRIGGTAAGTTTFNGVSGTRRFGAITKSFIRILEIKA
jgi:hypothetical protein